MALHRHLWLLSWGGGRWECGDIRHYEFIIFIIFTCSFHVHFLFQSDSNIKQYQVLNQFLYASWRCQAWLWRLSCSGGAICLCGCTALAVLGHRFASGPSSTRRSGPMIQSSGRDGLLETLQLQGMWSARMLGSGIQSLLLPAQFVRLCRGCLDSFPDDLELF